ncbi:MAG: hypothetical protein CMJ48_05550 [Planctomycetaceae bacterium]|nr:hypothetical protein [Planctomycetaceae bacterium]
MNSRRFPISSDVRRTPALAVLIASLTICVGLAVADETDAPRKGRIIPRGAASEELSWPQRIAAADVGSKDDAWAQTGFDDGDWKAMKLPVHFENAGLPGYDGVVWFRKIVDVPAELVATRATLSLGPIDDMDVTWINGRRVGGYEAPGAHFTPRNYTLTVGVLKPGKNLIAVRVMDHGAPGGIAGKPGQLAIRFGKQSLPLAGPWKYRAGADLATLKRVSLSVETAGPLPTPGPFTNGFELTDDDVVVFTGGTRTLKQDEFAYLETMLIHAAGKKRVYFRNMGWQADTVYRRQRPRNFGTPIEQLERVGATIVVATFGQMEALDGPGRLSEFVKAYEVALDEFDQRTKRIILVTPTPFERPHGNPHLPDLTKHNDAVTAYASAIRDLATRRGYLCVDLSKLATDGLTRDGVHLTAAGHWRVALETVTQLTQQTPVSADALNRDGAFENPKWELVRQNVLAKNRLWHQFRRPTNWSFAYGNRQHVPSSHDHRPGKPRWFPLEVDAIIPAIETTEDRILKLREENTP